MAEIRIENVSDLDFTDVSIAGEPYGDVAVGETTEYRRVPLRLTYALVRLKAGGHRVNAQTLNVWSWRFTHRIYILDLEAGHLAVEVVRERGMRSLRKGARARLPAPRPATAVTPVALADRNPVTGYEFAAGSLG